MTVLSGLARFAGACCTLCRIYWGTLRTVFLTTAPLNPFYHNPTSSAKQLPSISQQFLSCFDSGGSPGNARLGVPLCSAGPGACSAPFPRKSLANGCGVGRRDGKEPVESHMGKENWGIKPNVLNPSDFMITQNKHSLISPSGPEYLVLKQA